MSNFDLNTFLKNYKPKNLENTLEPYTKCNKLKNYKFLNRCMKNKLVSQRTYIKYVKINESFKDKHYDEHIYCGGILLDGGTIKDSKFIKSNDNESWTHLRLKYNLTDIVDNKKKEIVEPRIYIINISKYYIFYKIFNKNTQRDEYEAILVGYQA